MVSSRASSGSLAHATSSKRYVSFSASNLVGGIVASAIRSFLVRGRPIMLLLATVVLAYPFLVLSVATVNLVESLPPREPTR